LVKEKDLSGRACTRRKELVEAKRLTRSKFEAIS
jgi:hypothetical protein